MVGSWFTDGGARPPAIRRNGEIRSRASGGARRDRTDDLLLAKQALSQLSYGPDRTQVSVFSNQHFKTAQRPASLITDIRYLTPETGGPGKI
jgi:hypothetical protein